MRHLNLQTEVRYTDLSISDIFNFETGELLQNNDSSFSRFHFLKGVDIYVFLPDINKAGGYFGNYNGSIFLGHMSFINLTTGLIEIVDIKHRTQEWEYFSPLKSRKRDLRKRSKELHVKKIELGFRTHTDIYLPIAGSEYNFNLANLLPKKNNKNDGFVITTNGEKVKIDYTDRIKMFRQYGEGQQALTKVDLDLQRDIENSQDLESLQAIEDNFKFLFFDVIGE